MFSFQKIKKIAIVSILFTMIFSSCSKWIDPDLNIHPDQASEVPVSLLLPALEQRIAYNLGGTDYTLYTSAWVQYVFFAARSGATVGAGNITESDINNLWNSLYNGAMMDAYQMINYEPSSNYSSLAKILMALTLGSTTDVFGDVPYTQAFLGLENTQPAYDSQESIYQSIDVLLSEAITELEANSTSVSNDFIYGGNIDSWIKAAYSLKARYAIHLSHRDPNYATKTLSYISKGFQSNDEDLTFWFNKAPSENSPIYQFAQQRGDVAFSNSFKDLLEAENDPRLIIYQAYSGNTSDDCAGMYYGRPDGPVELMTYTELMFIAAEAALANGDDGLAKTYVKEGITSSINKYMNMASLFNSSSEGYTRAEQYDSEAPAWLTTKLTEVDNTTLDLEYIIIQKYFSRFISPESYNDFRRTGFPTITPYPNASIPMRYPYPTNERLYNTNLPKGTTKNTKIWWDNN